jgi:hypothetical protein
MAVMSFTVLAGGSLAEGNFSERTESTPLLQCPSVKKKRRAALLTAAGLLTPDSKTSVSSRLSVKFQVCALISIIHEKKQNVSIISFTFK